MRPAVGLAENTLAVIAGRRAEVVVRVAMDPQVLTAQIEGPRKVVGDRPVAARRRFEMPVERKLPSADPLGGPTLP